MNPSRFSVLRALSDGAFHSEESLSRATGLPPSGVQSALRGIEALGLRLLFSEGSTVRLPAPLDLIEPRALADGVSGISPGFRVEVIDECGSTNTMLSELAAAGAAHATVLVCEHQSAGRGRRSNVWLGSIGGSLAFSILWRFPFAPSALAGLSLAVAVGVARGLERRGLQGVSVKWPNDLYCRERKLGGILIESSGGSTGETAAVIGVGINMSLSRETRRQIGAPATDISSELAVVPTRTELLVELVGSIASVLNRFSGEGFAPFRDEWLSRHAWHGRQVELSSGGRPLAGGKIVGVGDDGALILSSDSGVERFHAGELSLRLE